MLTKPIITLLNSILVLVSFGQLTRISFPDQPIFFYAFEPLVCVVTVLMLYRSRGKLFTSSTAKISVGFLGWVFLSLLISLLWYPRTENIIAVLYFLRLATYISFLVGSIQFFQSYRIGTFTQGIIHGVSVWIILSSLIQYFLYPNLGNLAYLGWDPHLYRLVGLFFDPPMTISVFILITLYYVTQHTKSVTQIVGNGFIIMMFLILSFLTYSRGGYLGIMAIIGAFILHTKNIKLIGISVAVLVLVFLLIPKGQSEGINLLRTTSIGARFDDYEKAVMIWKKSPVTGIGYNHIRPEKDIYETQEFYGPYNPSHGSAGFHSSFLVILVTAGVVGLAVYLVYLWRVAVISPYFLYSIIFLSVISLFDNVLLHPFILTVLGYLGGIRMDQSSRS